jgi:hypothetical protein
MSFLSTVNVEALKAVTTETHGTQLAFINPDGSYVSIQPDGTEQTRVVGQSYGGTVWTGPAAYELGTPLGNGLVLFVGNGSAAFIRKYVL